MIKAKRILANFDARIPKIEVKPCNKKIGSKVIIVSKMHDETKGEKVKVKIKFKDVAGIDFRVNFFDSFIGCEADGLYCFDDKETINRIMHGIFLRRKEICLLEGDYSYDADDEADILNIFDFDGEFTRNIDQYKAYVQNVDSGVYIIVCKELVIEK